MTRRSREVPNLSELRTIELVRTQDGCPPVGVPVSICSFDVLSEQIRLQNPRIYQSENQQRRYGDWKYRWPLIVDQILKLNADIYCFQRVHSDHYLEYFLPLFEAGEFYDLLYSLHARILGNYDCIFTQRGSTYMDGNGFFFEKPVLIFFQVAYWPTR